MYTEHHDIKEFPYLFSFYKTIEDESVPLDEREESLIKIMDVECDFSFEEGVEPDSFKLYFPISCCSDSLQFEEGNIVKGSVLGMNIEGRILGISVSQLGKCRITAERV